MTASPKWLGPLSGGPRRGIHYYEALFVGVLYTLSNAALRGLRVILWPRRKPRDPERICVYRTGFIGDTVVALPAMHAIRSAYPRAHLTLLTSPVDGKYPGANELLANSDLFDEVRVYLNREVCGVRNRLVFLRALQRYRFDMWIELPQELAGPFGHLRNMLAARLIGVKWGYGWGFVTTIRLWVQAQSEFLKFPHEVEKLLAIVRGAGIPVQAVRFPIQVTAKEVASVDRLLGNSPPDLIAIAPGAKRSLSIWPAQRYVAVGQHLVSCGFQVVVLGGPADASVCKEVAEGIDGGVINLAGRTSLKESCEVLRRCRILICNDSGVQHLASAVGTSCISIFSAHDMPGKWSPWGEENVVLRKQIDCHTCYLRTCPRDNECIKMIGIEEVIAALDAKLQGVAAGEDSRRLAAGIA